MALNVLEVIYSSRPHHLASPDSRERRVIDPAALYLLPFIRDKEAVVSVWIES
jgi:hypothetical protein